MTVYYTAADIAEKMGLGYKRAANWANRGVLPEPAARTAGGRGLWSEEQVQDFIHFRSDWAEANTKRRTPKVYRPGERPIRRVPDFTSTQLDIAERALERQAS